MRRWNPSPRTQVGLKAEAAWEAVLSVVVGMVLGYYADRWLGTEPVLFFGFLLLGCVTGFRRLLRLAQQTLPPGDSSATADGSPGSRSRTAEGEERAGDEAGPDEPGP
jgi:F0F1-type ATP synthase assembly protein I